MHAKTVEGLVGASTSINLSDTSMKVFREARNKGDTATMERALGYAAEMTDQAEDYQAVADKGMEEDAKETREKARTEQEEAIRKRREDREKQEERIQESRSTDTDTVEISAEGRAVSENTSGTEQVELEGAGTGTAEEPVIYTRTGEAVSMEENPELSVTA